MIDTLCIGGGGAKGIAFYAALRDAHEHGIWKRQDIRHVFATSIGTVVSIVVLLSESWTDLDTYFLHRPWHQLFHLQDIFTSMSRRGLFGPHQLQQCVAPIFGAADVPLSITMSEFQSRFNVDLHFFSAKIDGSIESVDINSKTHPHWRVVDAMYASSALPLVFSPWNDGSSAFYMDGGLFQPYPVTKALEIAEKDHILGVCIAPESIRQECFGVDADTTTLFDYISLLIRYLASKTMFPSWPDPLPHEIHVTSTSSTLTNIYRFVYYEEERQALLDHGAQSFQRYLEHL